MITVANRVYVTPEYSAEFEERFRSRAKLVDGMPGFISNQVLRPVNEGDPYVVLTLWESRDNFTDWIKSDEFKILVVAHFYIQYPNSSQSLTSELLTFRSID